MFTSKKYLFESLIVSSSVLMATMACNHAMLDDDFPMVADVCVTDGDNSQKMVCINGEGFLRMWELNRDCDGEHEFEQALSEMGDVEVVCDADPCQMVVFEVYDDGSESSESGSGSGSESGSESGESGDWNSGDWNSTANETFETTPSAARRLVQGSDSAESTCDYSSTPDIVAFIIDACQAMGDSESIKITCTNTNDAMVNFFTNDNETECSGTATGTMTVSEYFGDMCGEMVACNVEAGEDFVVPTPAPTDGAVPSGAVLAPLLVAVALTLNA